MAYELPTYKSNVNVRTGKTATTIPMELAERTEESIPQVLAKHLGEFAREYVEKKIKLKDTADQADYDQRVLQLTSDIEQAKTDALGKVNYKDMYDQVVAPKLQQFQNDLDRNAFGYSQPVQAQSINSFKKDGETISFRNIVAIEELERENYTQQIQTSIQDQVASGIYSGSPDDPTTQTVWDRTEELANIIGEPNAIKFLEEKIVDYNEAKRKAIVEQVKNESISVDEGVEQLDAIELETNATVGDRAADEVNLGVASSRVELIAIQDKQFFEAKLKLDNAIINKETDFLTTYKEVRDKFSPQLKEALDQYASNLIKETGERIYEDTESLGMFPNLLAPDSFDEFSEDKIQGGSIVQALDIISRYSKGESIFKDRRDFLPYFSGALKRLTFNEAMKEAGKLDVEGQGYFLVMFAEEMEAMAAMGTPMGSYRKGLVDKRSWNLGVNMAFQGLTSVFPTVKAFDVGVRLLSDETSLPSVAEGGFVDRLIFTSNFIARNNKVKYVKNAIDKWHNFKATYELEGRKPTLEEYEIFEKDVFGAGYSAVIKEGALERYDASFGEKTPIITEEDQKWLENWNEKESAMKRNRARKGK